MASRFTHRRRWKARPLTRNLFWRYCPTYFSLRRRLGGARLRARLIFWNTVSVFTLFLTFAIGHRAFSDTSSVTFGYPNMTAEFLGVSSLIQSYALLFYYRSRWYTVGRGIFFATLVYWLMETHCRAALLGTLTGIGALLWLSPIFIRAQLATASQVVTPARRWAKPCTLFAPSSWPPSSLGLRETASASRQKQLNSKIRWWRWNNTIEMIAEHPLGVGPGQYEFAYLDYFRRHGPDPEISEGMVVRSPII